MLTSIVCKLVSWVVLVSTGIVAILRWHDGAAMVGACILLVLMATWMAMWILETPE